MKQAFSIVLKSSKHQEEAFKFVSWWTSKEIQVQYGRKLESVLGSAGRYSTANKEAIKELGWSNEYLKIIETQMSKCVGYPEVPGGYITQRQVNYAFYAVIDDGLNPRESLYLYSKDIQDELTKKRKEFG